MCGRFSQAQIAELDREVFRLLEVPPFEPRYNVAPTQAVAVVRDAEGGERELAGLRWGLIPHWTNDPSLGNRLINARSETVERKPAFRDAFRTRRCLVPADGFYEWRRTPQGKQPYYLRRDDGGVLAFAGLWDRWHDPAHGPVDSVTILTTTPNDLVAPIHNRMPVILPEESYDRWLDAGAPTRALKDLLAPYPARRMDAYAVSTYVNSPRNEGPECVAPLEP